MRNTLVSLFTLLSLTLVSCNPLEQATQSSNAPKPPEVDVAQPEKRTITEWDEFTGRFEAVQRVDIRARVSGYLVEQKFRDGQMVSKGDVLFVVDPRSFQYDLNRAQAEYNLAKKAFDRVADLRKTQSVAIETYDQRKQEMDVALAALEEAKLNVDFTEVKAPIDGRISDAFVDIGNLVEANGTLLTRIVSVDPIHFEFEGSQADLLKYLRMDQAGTRPSSRNNPNPIYIKLLDEDTFEHGGRMDFLDNTLDASTGTITGRALVENRAGVIYPGLFGRARLFSGEREGALLLPEKAIATDQNRKYVYVVNDENKAERVYVEVGRLLENGFIVIEDGLTGDERIVVNGIQRIRMPQQPVTPVDTELQWAELTDVPQASVIPSLDEIRNPPPQAAVLDVDTEQDLTLAN
ncbi:efflux RND transporter periplasmic adaptor subunit [Halioxenophilus aromaticivorans]|uniref:Efflux RND transporter periplasmic adaptor subunit n=1 Tax=Halioxenophilus aromaticivorans TaxID=1306992 RepID=A0AAV3TXH4_9ALTE